jgi:hypothetical protein
VNTRDRQKRSTYTEQFAHGIQKNSTQRPSLMYQSEYYMPNYQNRNTTRRNSNNSVD